MNTMNNEQPVCLLVCVWVCLFICVSLCSKFKYAKKVLQCSKRSFIKKSNAHTLKHHLCPSYVIKKIMPRTKLKTAEIVCDTTFICKIYEKQGVHVQNIINFYIILFQIQLLHCIHENTSGGNSIFVDGFHVAKQVYENHPDVFDVLKTFYVRFVDFGADAYGKFTFGYSHPIIKYVPSFHNFKEKFTNDQTSSLTPFDKVRFQHEMQIQREKDAYCTGK